MNSNINSLTKAHDAIRLLTKIQNAGFKSAILAGGAIRDMYHGVAVSDYDIFLWCPDLSNEWGGFKTMPPYDDIDYLAKLVGIKRNRSPYMSAFTGIISQYKPTTKGDYTINEHISSVWDITMPNADYQLIFVNERPVDYVLKYFDIGICKTYCDGKKIHFSEDFTTDVTNNTLTICAQDMSKAMFNYIIRHHLPRIKRKYPGYRVVVAPHNLVFVNQHNKKYL
jgi:hypothetical protein